MHCQYLCNYVDHSYATTRQELRRHKIRCKWAPLEIYLLSRYDCSRCGLNFDISYKSKHYIKCPGKATLTPPKRHQKKTIRSSNAKVFHTLVLNHYTCPQTQEIKCKRMRKSFSNSSDEEFWNWYRVNVFLKTPLEMAELINHASYLAENSDYLQVHQKIASTAHIDSLKNLSNDTYCSDAEQSIYLNMDNTDLLIL